MEAANLRFEVHGLNARPTPLSGKTTQTVIERAEAMSARSAVQDETGLY